MFDLGMGTFADASHAVQRRRKEARRVAIRPTADERLADREAEIFRRGLGSTPKPAIPGGSFERGGLHPALYRNTYTGRLRLECADTGLEPLSVFHRHDTNIDDRRRGCGDDVGSRATRHLSDVYGRSRPRIVQLVKLSYDVRQFRHGARTRLRIERECLDLWASHGFRVFDRFDDVEVFAPNCPPGGYMLLEYVSKPKLNGYLSDEAIPVEERIGTYRRWLGEWGRRHEIAIREREPRLVHENGDGKLSADEMPGRMGGKRITVQNLKVVQARPEDNVLLISGAVPGAKGGYVIIRPAIKKPASLHPAGQHMREVLLR